MGRATAWVSPSDRAHRLAAPLRRPHAAAGERAYRRWCVGYIGVHHRQPAHARRRAAAGLRADALVVRRRHHRASCTFVPLIIFGLLGGSIADAVDRRQLMLVTSRC